MAKAALGGFLLIAFFPLASGDIPVRDVRRSFFILQNPFSNAEEFVRASSPGQDSVWKKESQIGRFVIVHCTSSQVLCRLVTGTPGELDGSCYIRMAEPAGQNQKAKPLSLQPSPKIPVKPSAGPPPADPELHVAELAFRKIGDSFLSEKSLPFSRFQTLENLNGFLSQLETSAGKAYQFSIPSDRFIQEQAARFPGERRDGFYLCLVSGRIGYYHTAGDGAIAFKSISVATLSAMVDKFHFYVVAKKNE